MKGSEVKPKSRTATHNTRTGLLFSTACVLAALMGFGLPSAAQGASPAAPFYALTDLGTGSGIVSHAVAINEAGDVVGETNHEYAPTLAFLYSGGVLRELLDSPGEQSSAIALNDRGEIVVWSTSWGYAVYNAGVTTPLPGNFYPQDIDNGGRVVGSSNAQEDEHNVWAHPHGAVYSDGAVVDLGFVGAATAINERGDMAGFRVFEDALLGPAWHAFLRPAGGTDVDLGSLHGHAGQSWANDMSEQGVVVGLSSTPLYGYHAFRYRPGGTMEDLGTIDEYGHSAAHAVNTRGDIVGEATCQSDERPLHAALWRDGELWDLNDLIPPGTGWTLEGAIDINDAGSVVGWGWFAGHRRAVLLTPAPVQQRYQFGGFAPPIDARPTVNVVRAGATVPVRFSLGGYQGTDFFASGYPRSQTACVGLNAPVDPVEQTSTAGASGLTYSPGTGLYTYPWKTDPAWAGTHRQIVLGLADGTYYRATFDFR